MDVLLFERYMLNLNENNLNVINSALEKSKNESKWVGNLKSKNNKILSEAKKKQSQWENDRAVLTDTNMRTAAVKQISKGIEEIINYIDEQGEDEAKYSNAVSAFIEYNLKASDIEMLYKKYSSIFGIGARKIKISDYKVLARKLATPYGAFVNLLNNLDDNVKLKFYEAGIDLSDFSSTLRLDECCDRNDVIKNSEHISTVAYEIYNKKLLKIEEKNAFMEIFSANSNSENSIVKIACNQRFEDFSFAGWAVVKDINYVCRFMDSSSIKSENISEIAQDRRFNFVKAMEKFFNVKAESFFDSANAEKAVASNELPKEIKQGEAELKKSEFEKAKRCFQISVNKNPYCWQGYWGLFKAEIGVASDDQVCMPGFMNELGRKNSGEPVEEAVELYSQARELAISQQAKEINFYSIENRFREADRKEEEFERFEDDLAAEYSKMNEDNIKNKNYVPFVSDFKKKAKVYSKNKSLVEDGFIGNIFLLLLGAYAALVGFMGILVATKGTCPDAISITAIVFGLAASIAIGILFISFWRGFIAFGILFSIAEIVSEVLYNSLISFIIMIAGILSLIMFVLRATKRYRLKRTFDNDTKEIIEYIMANVFKCFWEDLMEYYNANKLDSYGIVADTSDIAKVNFEKYFLLMNGAMNEIE